MFSYRNILKIINYLCRACGVSSASTSISTAIALIIGKYASSGPTSITLEQAALGGLTIGKQYIISDWQSDLLYAHSATVLKPVSGSITIMNGETLPAGVEPEILYIDSGEVNTNTTSPYSCSVTTGYIIWKNTIKITSSDDVNTFYSDTGVFQYPEEMGINSFYSIFAMTYKSDDLSSITIYPSQTDRNTVFRTIIEFHRSKLN